MKSGFVPDNTNIKKSSVFFDSRDNVFFERNPKNVAYEVTSTQLPAMVGGAFVDLFLTDICVNNIGIQIHGN